jgi:hypothetical protein
MTEEQSMSTHETSPTPLEPSLYRPVLGVDGDPCAVCEAPLASDQRYCLNCGARRAEARLPFQDLLARPVAAPAPPPPEPPRRATRGLSAIAAGCAGATLLALGLLTGGLLARDRDEPTPVAATKPPVVNITNQVPAGGGATEATPVSFTSDWPADQEGWTIELERLPKDATTPEAVQAAKDDAAATGAPDVGALDADEYASLDPGAYVVYSGVFDSRKQARAALRDLKADFPDAKTVEVTSGGGQAAAAPPDEDAEVQSQKDLEQKEKLSPEEAQKQIRKAPSKVQSEGEPPPTDSEKPGGGSEATEIG